MGQRCNLIIVENGAYRLYYDHWAANRLDDELFWGPYIARTFIKQRDEAPDSWLDDVWSEGGCVLDVDRQHLLWYGGEDVLYDPADNLIHAELMQHQWEGWTVKWAIDGIFELADYVGVARETVQSNGRFDPDEITLPKVQGKGGPFLYADAVVSYSQGDSRRFGVLRGLFDGFAHPDLNEATLCSMIDRFSLERFNSDAKADPGWGRFRWGAHLDFDTRVITTWCSEPYEGLFDRLAAHWTRWNFDFRGPQYQWHADLLPMLDWPKADLDAKLLCIDNLRKRIGERSVENPAVGLIERMPGSDIQVNPQVWEHRDQPGPADEKLARLDALEAVLRGH